MSLNFVLSCIHLGNAVPFLESRSLDAIPSHWEYGRWGKDSDLKSSGLLKAKSKTKEIMHLARKKKKECNHEL